MNTEDEETYSKCCTEYLNRTQNERQKTYRFFYTEKGAGNDGNAELITQLKSMILESAWAVAVKVEPGRDASGGHIRINDPKDKDIPDLIKHLTDRSWKVKALVAQFSEFWDERCRTYAEMDHGSTWDERQEILLARAKLPWKEFKRAQRAHENSKPYVELFPEELLDLIKWLANKEWVRRFPERRDDSIVIDPMAPLD